MTGGVLPEGADGVVKKENAEDQGRTVLCWRSPGPGGNIRLKGEAFKKGEVVLSAGDVVGPVEVCELASLRRAHVHVFQKPVVAIISTGDELSDFHEPASPGKTMCSTLYGLAAQVLETGAVPLLLGIAPDNPLEQQTLLSQGLRADVVITSGGISRGKYDFVRETFQAMGVDIKFRNIALKPGKPAVFGAINRTLVFGFPGNPSATMISFEQFVKPALLKMMGRKPVGKTHESPFSGIDSFRLDSMGLKADFRASLVPCRNLTTGESKTGRAG
jgi:molybdopterin molybdotransferase